MRSDFLEDLRASYIALGEEQRRLEALKDLAEYDGLHPEIVRTLARKAAVLGYTREDLKQVGERLSERTRT